MRKGREKMYKSKFVHKINYFFFLTSAARTRTIRTYVRKCPIFRHVLHAEQSFILYTNVVHQHMRLRHHLPFSCLPVAIEPPPHVETALFPRLVLIVYIHHNAKRPPKMMRTRPIKVNVWRVNVPPQFRLLTPNFVDVYCGCIGTRHCACKIEWKTGKLETGNWNEITASLFSETKLLVRIDFFFDRSLP